MNFEPGTLITAVAAIAGIGSTWGVLNRRVRVLEEQLRAVKDLGERVTTADAKIEFVRTDQGRRLGDLEKSTNALAGRFEGWERGFGAGRRSRTAASGHKIGGAE